MERPRGPDDSLPTQARCFQEKAAVRYELPVTVAGVKGLLVIRCRENQAIEVSIRGKAAEFMERLQ